MEGKKHNWLIPCHAREVTSGVSSQGDVQILWIIIAREILHHNIIRARKSKYILVADT